MAPRPRAMAPPPSQGPGGISLGDQLRQMPSSSRPRDGGEWIRRGGGSLDPRLARHARFDLRRVPDQCGRRCRHRARPSPGRLAGFRGSGVEAKGHPAPGDCPTDVAAAVGEMCPCAGKTLPNDSVQPWKNHGQYVSCVVRFRNALRKAGCFADDSVRRTLARCAARSTCGKADAVVCCFSDAGACNDASPGDGTAAGTCSNDLTMACDGDAGCTKTRARIARDEASCAAAGGTNGGSASVCVACTTTTTSTSTTTTTTLP